MGMTREEAKHIVDVAFGVPQAVRRAGEDRTYHEDEIREAKKMAIKALEQEPTTKNDLGVDCISRARAIERLKLNLPISQGADNSRDRHRYMQALADIQAIRELPSVTPQEPKCKDCKWWKDSDGEYRRGCGAESKCPINRREVFEGNGYCYLFEPQESEDKE